MVSLLLMLRRLIGAVRTAWRDHTFRAAALSTVILITAATIFYVSTEGWSVVDSLYFAVATGLTIGYGDLVPSGPGGKIFTIVYALLAVGLFVTVAASLAKAVLDDAARRRDQRARRRPGSATDERED